MVSQLLGLAGLAGLASVFFGLAALPEPLPLVLLVLLELADASFFAPPELSPPPDAPSFFAPPELSPPPPAESFFADAL